MLAGQGAAERRGEGHDVVEQLPHACAPVRFPYIHERVDVHMRVAGVAEDDPAESGDVECPPHAAHVVAESIGRDAAVLDQLHRPEMRVEARQDRARGLAERPQRLLGLGVQPHEHGARAQ
ncbi:MAG: hypothetical protein IPF98_07845 [Gemmatimonadetes bacterium]|nr:hypothetical protein [Gemmatimonadota bacterium]